jgi:hypothetical protein
MNPQEITKKLFLINAQSKGWQPPDCAESLDQLFSEARRWIQRWDNDNAALTKDEFR